MYYTKADERQQRSAVYDDQKEREARQARIDNEIWKTTPSNKIYVRVQRPIKYVDNIRDAHLRVLKENAAKENEAKYQTNRPKVDATKAVEKPAEQASDNQEKKQDETQKTDKEKENKKAPAKVVSAEEKLDL